MIQKKGYRMYIEINLNSIDHNTEVLKPKHLIVLNRCYIKIIILKANYRHFQHGLHVHNIINFTVIYALLK